MGLWDHEFIEIFAVDKAQWTLYGSSAVMQRNLKIEISPLSGLPLATQTQ